MINWRFAVLAVLGAASVAVSITYFVAAAPPQPVAADQRLPPTLPIVTIPPDTAKSATTQNPGTEDDAATYQRAAAAILRRAQNAKASTDEPAVSSRIPLPKKRPIPRS